MCIYKRLTQMCFKCLTQMCFECLIQMCFKCLIQMCFKCLFLEALNFPFVISSGHAHFSYYYENIKFDLVGVCRTNEHDRTSAQNV